MSMDFHDFVHQTSLDDIPDEIITQARYWMLDLIGVAAAGRTTQLSNIICDHAVDQFGGTSAGILFDGRKSSAAGAALAGGMIIDSLDAHDGHKLTKGHVGCGVFPAILSLCQAEQINSQDELLTSLILGYELGTRAGIALHETAPDYHTSGAWVSVAIAALGARAMGLSKQQTREAIGIAEYHGPRSQMMRVIDAPTMLKDGSGWGAMAGVSAAYLARSGFTGAPALTVEGDQVTQLWSDLGSNWRINEQYYKPFPVCRWAQPGIQAVLNLRNEHDLKSHEVERIELATFHESLRLAGAAPQTTEQAQYSTAYSTAVALVRGKVDPQDVQEESFSDIEINRLAQGMIVTERQDYNDAFPAERYADVTLILKDGTRLNSGKTKPSGDPEEPATKQEMIAKYRSYAGPVLGSERSAAIEKIVLSESRDGALEPLLKLLTDPLKPHLAD